MISSQRGLILRDTDDRADAARGWPRGSPRGVETGWLRGRARVSRKLSMHPSEILVEVQVRASDGRIEEIRCSLPSSLLNDVLRQIVRGSNLEQAPATVARLREHYRAPASHAICLAFSRAMALGMRQQNGHHHEKARTGMGPAGEGAAKR